MKHQRRYILFSLALLFYQAVSGQSYRIGTIDLYGNREVPASIIYSRLTIKQGDSIDPVNFKKEEIIARLTNVAGVKHVSISPVCCNVTGDLMVYVGIGESDAIILNHRPAPITGVFLPDSMIAAYYNYEDEIHSALKKQQAGENDSMGYALMNYPPARKQQLRFLAFAGRHLPLVISVLRNSASAEHREAAATIIAYSSERSKVAEQLIYAADDPDETVRNNATRALGILAGYAGSHPELGIHIPAGPFIRLVNSNVWTDRNKGASVLMQLTEKRDKKVLDEIKKQAWPSIVEMAKWKERGHAFFSFVILCRIAGVEDSLIFEKNFSPNWAEELEKILNSYNSSK